MAPRRRSELYRLAVALAAAAVAFATRDHLLAVRPDWPLVVTLGLTGLVALRFPLQVSLAEKFSVASAVFFASALLVPAWDAAVLAAATSAVDTGIAVARKFLRTRERPPFRAVALTLMFNSGQFYFSVLAAGLVVSAGGVSVTRGVPSTEQALTLLAAAIAMYGTNVLMVATAAALQTARHPFRTFRNTHRLVSAQFASLYLVGAAAAFATAKLPWLPVFGVVPLVLAYFSLRHRIELRKESRLAMERMAEEVDRRDPYTFQHSQRVAIYSHAIAKELGFSAAEIELVELAAKVHDVGKIRISDAILLKPGRLTAEERRVMETHPRLGAEILSQFSEYTKVLDLVLMHHERYDGRGYPNRAVGRQLLLIAQVIPVADSLDAMTSARAYRGARTWDVAMEELRRGAGSQWNPKVVDAALRSLFGEPARGDVPRSAAAAIA